MTYPGDDNPGWSRVIALDAPIPPHEAVTVRYPGPFTDDRSDGSFRTEVGVVRFTQIERPSPISY
jgi:hypothetical protein